MQMYTVTLRNDTQRVFTSNTTLKEVLEDCLDIFDIDYPIELQRGNKTATIPQRTVTIPQRTVTINMLSSLLLAELY